MEHESKPKLDHPAGECPDLPDNGYQGDPAPDQADASDPPPIPPGGPFEL